MTHFIYKPGCFADIPAGEYHQAAREGRYLSSHLLADFRTAPKLYHTRLISATSDSETPALLFGRAAHAFILEGREAFENEFLVSDGPLNPKTGEPFGRSTKAFREWQSAQKKTVFSGSEFALIAKLREAVWTHPLAMSLLNTGFAEQTVRANLYGEPCQIRIDWFTQGPDGRPAIVDLKTCDNLDQFERDAKRFGYPNQLAFYREVLAVGSAGQVVADTYLIGVEKREPYRCGVWKLTDSILESATRANEQAIRELQACRREDRWPTRYEDLRPLDL